MEELKVFCFQKKRALGDNRDGMSAMACTGTVTRGIMSVSCAVGGFVDKIAVNINLVVVA